MQTPTSSSGKRCGVVGYSFRENSYWKLKATSENLPGFLSEFSLAAGALFGGVPDQAVMPFLESGSQTTPTREMLPSEKGDGLAG